MLSSRVIRKRKRLYSQRELGALLGVHPKTISRLEADPLPELLVRYLALLDYNVSFYPKGNRDKLVK